MISKKSVRRDEFPPLSTCRPLASLAQQRYSRSWPPALLGQSGQCPTSTRFRRQTNEPMNERADTQKDSAIASRKSAVISASQSVQPGIQRTLRDLDTGWCITRHACLLPQLSPGTHFSLTTEGGIRLSRSACLVLRRGGLPVQRRSPT